MCVSLLQIYPKIIAFLERFPKMRTSEFHLTKAAKQTWPLISHQGIYNYASHKVFYLEIHMENFLQENVKE